MPEEVFYTFYLTFTSLVTLISLTALASILILSTNFFGQRMLRDPKALTALSMISVSCILEIVEATYVNPRASHFDPVIFGIAHYLNTYLVILVMAFIANWNAMFAVILKYSYQLSIAQFNK